MANFQIQHLYSVFYTKKPTSFRTVSTMPTILILLLSMTNTVYSSENMNVDGNNGTLYLRGILTESACRIETASAYQEIDLGDIGTGRLQNAGDQGMPIWFKLRITDCLNDSVDTLDSRFGVKTIVIGQPAVKVSFNTTLDDNNSQLVKLQGVTGLGLRIKDVNGRDVNLGTEGRPLVLMPGKDTLNYQIIPERTSGELVAGYYRAVVDFNLSYY